MISFHIEIKKTNAKEKTKTLKTGIDKINGKSRYKKELIISPIKINDVITKTNSK